MPVIRCSNQSMLVVVGCCCGCLCWWLLDDVIVIASIAYILQCRSSRCCMSTGGVLDPYSALIPCLLYTSDAADEEDSVDLGGRRIIKKKKKKEKAKGGVTKRKHNEQDRE
eukprot:TRINITY_DN6086_c0_g1_i1.p1 TRINITY_DN6086_c0_g1~~TRINITY_DN6086_c0_g1_i1.p1  ORF type:complete len:111 (-),score=10.63 TRINITY_DN6086_c0_g1_i1:61-393(-)